ncbi:cyclic nucleotide-binding domain-containing protein [Caldimonas thermodepolymerans]|jgi:cAMP-binding proteins - catabolite gene activator and regulatory subunit of cAMP-dependent protein kinases|uniref:cyclic nucleotide-binding domain-containing protein n=1 Tax=Caldimonas thermodepolymerans TaxID=215580 RepID=UPI00248F4D16|nr:cyclic nucleotide-binding domain-containing protein [Caldimonas thermodepolymerans]
MKKLIEKLKGGASTPSQPASAAASGEDSGFFSTMFQERSDEDARFATWAERAREVEAQPHDCARGAARFAELWGVDRYVATLERDELERMAQYLEFVEVPAGKEVIGQDEQGDYMLIVLDGTIAVDRVQPWGGRARLAEAHAGDMLGEMSLLDAGSRFSACTTVTPCVLAVVDAQGLDRMIMQEPRLGLALLASLARRLSLRLRQVSARLSALLSRS